MNKIIFAMYNQKTDSVEVTLDNQFHITFNCQNCNAQVKLGNMDQSEAREIVSQCVQN